LWKAQVSEGLLAVKYFSGESTKIKVWNLESGEELFQYDHDGFSYAFLLEKTRLLVVRNPKLFSANFWPHFDCKTVSL